jgi:hypothetical protein
MKTRKLSNREYKTLAPLWMTPHRKNLGGTNPLSRKPVQHIIAAMKTGLCALICFLVLPAVAQTDTDHHAGVVQRGESHAGMGFSQTTTTHHFVLTEKGGFVQVTANDPNDKDQIETVQMHLKHIASLFSDGNFSIPHFVHDQNPPGADTMRKMKKSIQYSEELLTNGGRVKMESSSPQAVAAIHDFLRFQINDHQTGDPLTVATKQ